MIESVYKASRTVLITNVTPFFPEIANNAQLVLGIALIEIIAAVVKNITSIKSSERKN